MACLLLLLALPWPAQAYDNDTHYVLTYYLARKVGFTMEQARQIASANVSVDAEPMTEPLQTGQVLNPSGDAQTPRWLFHAFPDSRVYDRVYQRAIDHGQNKTDAHMAAARAALDQRDAREKLLLERGFRTGNPGQYLHFYQDTFSHDGYWSRLGHATSGHAPDFIGADLAKAQQMAEGTVAVLRRFMRACLSREPLDPSVPDMHRVLRRLADINPVASASNQVFNYNMVGRGVPNWEDVADFISHELGEPLPDWIQYKYLPDGPSGDANWRVQGCRELQGDGELRIKVVDAATRQPLDGAKVSVRVPGADTDSASGVTRQGVLDVRLAGRNLSYRVEAGLSGYARGSSVVKFGCTECESIAVLSLVRNSGEAEAEFERNLSAAEASLRQRVAHLRALTAQSQRQFDQALQTAQGLLAQREATRAPPRAGTPLFAAMSAELGAASGLCSRSSAASAKLGAVLSQLDEQQQNLEQLLRRTHASASTCADAASLGNAQNGLRQGSALYTGIDQQATTLALLAMQVQELDEPRRRLLQQRGQATQALDAHAAAQAQRGAAGAAHAAPIDFSVLLAALEDLKIWDRTWRQRETDAMTGTLAPFRQANQELVPSSRISAGIARLNGIIQTLAGAEVDETTLRQRADLLAALQSRAAALAAPAPPASGETAARQTLAAAVQAAACLDQAPPDMRVGMARAEGIRASAALALDKLGGDARLHIQRCQAKLSGQPLDKQALVAQKVCAYPGSEAIWGDKENRPMCRCIAGSKWNAAQTECVAVDKVAEVAAKVCAYAGSEAVWSDKDHRAMCRCKTGSKWNDGQTACVADGAARVAAADCSRYPHTAARWNDDTQKVVCSCVAGYTRNGDSCVADKRTQMAELDCARWPGSVATWDANNNKARCNCPTGTRYDNITQACEPDRDKLVAAHDCSRYAHSVPYWDEGKQKPLCRCKPGFHSNTARTACEAPAPPVAAASAGPRANPSATLIGKWTCEGITNGVRYYRLFAGDPLEHVVLNNEQGSHNVEFARDARGLYMVGGKRTPKIYPHVQAERRFSGQSEWPGVNRVSYQFELSGNDQLSGSTHFVSLNTPSDYTTQYRNCKRVPADTRGTAGGA